MTAPSTRSFYYAEMIIGTVVFMTVFLTVARSAIPDPHGRPIGLTAAFLALATACVTARMPYAAKVSADRSVTFKALTRRIKTTISAIHRIEAQAAGGRGGGGTYIFYFDGSCARLGGTGGYALARYVVAQNPAVDHPSRLTASE